MEVSNMSNVLFIGDLHFGHSKIMQFEGDNRTGDNFLENIESIVSKWNAKVSKRDLVWIMGDVAFSMDGFDHVKRLNGSKKLILGNHDQFKITKYAEVFNEIHGIKSAYGFWLSHAPIHPLELRNKKNIHGHVHSQSIPDSRYVNVSCENINETPISLDEIRKS